jgi:hypothetical protein
MTKYIALAISAFTLFMWTQTHDYWLLVTSLAWLVIFALSDDFAKVNGKVNK